MSILAQHWLDLSHLIIVFARLGVITPVLERLADLVLYIFVLESTTELDLEILPIVYVCLHKRP